MNVRTRMVRVIQACCFGLIAAFAFFPYVAEQLPFFDWMVPGVAWLAALAELHRKEIRGGLIAGWVAVPVLLGCASYFFATLPDVVLAPLGSLPAILNQYFFVFPVAIVAGIICSRSPQLGQLVGALRVLGFLSALLALVERATGHLFFPGNVVATNFGSSHTRAVTVSLSDSGTVRGIVASYHPLVLGTLLAVVVAIALTRPGRKKLVEVPVLLAGIYATDSLGPLGIAAALVGVAVVRALMKRAGAPPVRTGAVLGGFAAVVAAFLGLSVFVWQPIVDAGSGVDVSTQYRFALFSMIPRVLASMPFGLGLGDLPPGRFLIESSGHPIDISASVDSELVLLVLQLGLLGLGAFFAVLALAVRNSARGVGSPLGSWALLAMTLGGLTVALHVWFTDSVLWCLLIGVGLAALRRPDVADDAVPAADTLREPIAEPVGMLR